jgi:hypothetical protein
MGRSSIFLVLAAVPALCGCRDAGAVPLRTVAADLVTLQLGGDGPKLGDELRRRPPAPRARTPVEIPPLSILSKGPARRFREVRLPPGWTLSRLCEEELGASARWREVAELNGWSETEVGQLPSGVLVRLPPLH